jgi:hypothetical protein
MHLVPVEPILARRSLTSLVQALNQRLVDEERILVFFGAQADVEIFAKKNRCAVYHSQLWQAGNTKSYNLDLWDRGESKVMACTTAFAQGIDRSNVRYVVIFRPAYGLLVNNQMLGRAGRDGKESHVFFVTDASGIASFRGTKAVKSQCVEELDDVVHGNECRRYSTTLCMDGVDLAVRCTDKPRGVPCDVCAPDSPMQRFAMEAINTPLVTSPEASDSNGTSSVQTAPPAFIPASALHRSIAADRVSLTAFRVLTLYSCHITATCVRARARVCVCVCVCVCIFACTYACNTSSVPGQRWDVRRLHLADNPLSSHDSRRHGEDPPTRQSLSYHAAHSAEADHVLSFIACIGISERGPLQGMIPFIQ